MGYNQQAVTQKLARQGEYILRVSRHTGQGRHPSNQDETGSDEDEDGEKMEEEVLEEGEEEEEESDVVRELLSKHSEWLGM
jgi:hypothetical protein